MNTFKGETGILSSKFKRYSWHITRRSATIQVDEHTVNYYTSVLFFTMVYILPVCCKLTYWECI